MQYFSSCHKADPHENLSHIGHNHVLSTCGPSINGAMSVEAQMEQQDNNRQLSYLMKKSISHHYLHYFGLFKVKHGRSTLQR